MKTALIALIGLSVCFALGWRLGLTERDALAAGFQPAANGASFDKFAAQTLKKLQSTTDPLDRRLALLSLVENADATELEVLFTTARLGDDPAARDAAARRWAELDPEGFYRHLTQLPAEDMAELNEAALILFSAWGRSHPEAALAAAKTSSRQEGFKGVHWAALSAVLEHDPEKGFALALKGETLRYGREIQKSLWDKDPVRFVRACEVLDASGRRVPEDLQQARGDALMAWSETDFPGALAWTRTLNASAQAALLPRLINKLAAANLPQARELFESLPPSPAREAAGSVIAGALARQDPQAALELIQTMTGGRAEAYGKWMNAVAEKGLDHAAGVLETLPEGSGRDQALRSLAGLWVAKDLPRAVNWFKNLPDAPQRREAFDGLKWEWSEKDRAGLQDYIATAPAGDLPDDYEHSLNLFGSKEEQTEQLHWAAGLPEERRGRVFNNNLHQASWNHPPALVAEMLTGIPDPAVRQSAAAQAVKNMLNQDPGKAGQFLEALPAGLFIGENQENLRQTITDSARLTAPEKQSLLGKLR